MRPTNFLTPLTGLIWFDNVICEGTEESLLDCPQNVIGDNNCDHDDDAACACFGITTDIGIDRN